MADQPTAPLLLEVARSTLLDLLPQVDEVHHYALRMVANALAIAGREITATDGSALDCEALRLRMTLRDGAAGDVPRQRELHAALLALTRARLTVSNPKLLGAMALGNRP